MPGADEPRYRRTLDPNLRNSRWFYTSLAVMAIALSVAGFAPSIVNPADRRGPLTPLVIGHATFMGAWL